MQNIGAIQKKAMIIDWYSDEKKKNINEDTSSQE